MTDATSPSPERIWRRDYAVPTHLIESTELTFELDPERTVVRSKLSLQRHPDSPVGAALVLHGEQLETQSIQVDGQSLPQEVMAEADRTGRLTLEGLPQAFVLEASVVINPQANKALEGLIRSCGRAHHDTARIEQIVAFLRHLAAHSRVAGAEDGQDPRKTGSRDERGGI